MEAIDHRHIRILDDFYRGRFTPFGRAVLLGAVAAVTFLLGGLSLGVSAHVGFFSALILVAWVGGLGGRPQVRLRRRLPPPGSAGETWSYDVEVENLGSTCLEGYFVEERALPSELRPAGEAVALPSLDPGAVVVVRLRLQLRRRGAFRLTELQVASAFPSGLLKSGARVPVDDRVLVYPRFSPMEPFEVPVGRTHQPGGVPAAAKVGESSELLGLRAWREGDRVRDVHWPSFGRTGRLVVREFQEEYFARLALVIDLSPAVAGLSEWRRALEATALEAKVEQALSVAAALTDVLARQDFLIDLVAAGDKVQRFTTGRALDHMEHVLELLACLESGDRLDTVALSEALVPEASRLSVVFFVLTGWDPAWRTLIEQVRGLGLAVRVVMAAGEAPPDALGADELVRLG